MANPLQAGARAGSEFLVLPAHLRPSALAEKTRQEVISVISEAKVPMFATEELGIVVINAQARPAFQKFGEVVGTGWPDFLRRYWEPEAAEEVVAIITNTLKSGTPYSSIGYAARRNDGVDTSYDWEVHRIITADRVRMLLCYFNDRR